MTAPPTPWLWPWLGLLATYSTALVWVLWPCRHLGPPPVHAQDARIPAQRRAPARRT